MVDLVNMVYLVYLVNLIILVILSVMVNGWYRNMSQKTIWNQKKSQNQNGMIDKFFCWHTYQYKIKGPKIIKVV